MAKIGLKYPVYKTAAGVGGVIGKAIQGDVSIELNNVSLYADDALAEEDKSFKSGKITLGVDELTDSVQVAFLGHTADVSGEMTANVADVLPYIGIGFYGKKMVSGVTKYRALWFPKVQFAEPADSNKTKGESTEFATPSIEGTIFKDDNGDWKKEQTFTTEADAIAYLNAKSGLPVSASGGLTALVITGTGGTLAPAFGVDIRSYAYTGLTGASFTVTATAALHTISLYVDGVFNQSLTSGSASASIAMASIGTKKLTIIAQESGKQSQTTEIVVVKTA